MSFSPITLYCLERPRSLKQ
ncbi:hypothetical protein LINPERHAP2_LOCUS15594 [Linum perenne]